MTTPQADAAPEGGARPARARSRWAQTGAEAVAVALTAVIVAGLGVYGSRREVARGLAEAWLREQGLSGTVRVERLDADGFSGSLRVGPANDPDLAVDRLEVDLGLEPAWAEEPFALSARTVRLVRPRLKAELGADGLTFGRLDPTVREFLARPSTDDAPGPLVLIEDGAVRLTTPYGLVRVRGSGAVDDGRLVRFDGRVLPARLRGEGLSADLGDALVRLERRGERLTGRATLAAEEVATAAGWTVEDGQAVVELDAPYPEGEVLAVEGPVVVRAALDAAAVAGPEGSGGRAVTARLLVQGRAAGPLARVEMAGSGELEASAATAEAEPLGLQRVTARLAAGRLRLARTESGPAAEGAGQARITAARARAGEAFAEDAVLTVRSRDLRVGEGGPAGPLSGSLEARRARLSGVEARGLALEADAHAALLRAGGAAGLAVRGSAERLGTTLDGRTVGLTQASARFSGPARRTAEGFGWRAEGAASGRGALSETDAGAVANRIPVLGGEDSHRADIVDALRAFAVRAPELALTVRPEGGTTLAAAAPVRMEARSGAVLTARGAPLLALGEGAARGDLAFSVMGGGLPEAELALNGWRAGAGGFASPVRLRASGLDATIARNATVEARGRVRLSGGAFRFDAAGCIPVTAAEIEFGENDLADASAEVCPTTAPLIKADEGGYRLRGRFRRAAVSAPVAEARASGGDGAFAVTGGEAGLRTADIRLRTATVADQAPETRYLPLRLSGGIGLARGLWNGTFAVGREGVELAEIAVRHADGAGVGSAVIDARGVTFAPDGLQPGDLSPLAAIAADASGTVDFTGRFDWTPEGVTSGGRLATQGLSFRSPAGPVTGVGADIAFTSLTPLLTAPDQRVAAQRVEALAELTDLATAITLSEGALRLEHTAFAVGGGRVSIETLAIPVDGSGTFAGTVVVDDVQLGALVEAVNLGERVSLDAVVDGVIPFEVGPGRVRFENGRLAAVRPGRLSIQREALDAVAASPAGETPAAPGQVNAIQDFAYQAMENLAFNRLELTVNSLPEGRLGLLFRINGEHDPEVVEEARIGFFEALRGRAFQRRIPLPKGTPVNLTLDSSLNFDELLQAWLNVARSRQARSEGVQPPRPTSAS